MENLKPYIDLMFKAISKEVLIALYNQAITMCKDSNNSDMILLKLMGKIILGSIYN